MRPPTLPLCRDFGASFDLLRLPRVSLRCRNCNRCRSARRQIFVALAIRSCNSFHWPTELTSITDEKRERLQLELNESMQSRG